MKALPSFMLASNGVRRGKADHPDLPVTIPETPEATPEVLREAVTAGADGLRHHVRNSEGSRSPDAGRYREVPSALAATCPDLAIRITTEAGGLNSSERQIAIVDEVATAYALAALRELRSTGSRAVALAAPQRWAEQEIAVQHILCGADGFEALLGLLGAGTVARSQLLFVLGSYSPEIPVALENLGEFRAISRSLSAAPDWAGCAFGARETRCLVAAHQAGGKVRSGLEDSDVNASGRIAALDASRVAILRKAISPSEVQASE